MVRCMLIYRNIYVNQWRYIWCGGPYKIYTPRRCIRIFGEICGNLWTTTPLQIPTDSHKSPQTSTDRHRPSSDSRPKSPQISYRSLWISTGSHWLHFDSNAPLALHTLDICRYLIYPINTHRPRVDPQTSDSIVRASGPIWRSMRACNGMHGDL